MSQAPTSNVTRASVQGALADLINAFAVDDYQLTITDVDASVLRLAIDAGPNACAECLVPERALSNLIRHTLAPADIVIPDIQIRYPLNAHGGVDDATADDEAVADVEAFRTLSLYTAPGDVADGVATLPVSRRRLADAVAASGRPADSAVGAFPGRSSFSVGDLARIAVLAGCREEAMPLLVTAFEILADPKFPIALFTHSRGSFFPYLVVNGPIRTQLDVNCRSNVFGPGARANATIGRAVRLGLARFAGAAMDATGPSALGTAYRYACVVGEDEETSPWPPLHTELGLDAQTSSVMVLAARQPGHVTHQLSVDPSELARAFADELNRSHFYQDYDVALPAGGHAPKAILVIGEDHRGYFRDAGWGRSELKAALFDATVRDPDAVRASGYTLAGAHPPFVRADGAVSPYASPDDFMIVGAGSGGGRSMIGSAVYGAIRAVPPVPADIAPPTAVSTASGSPVTIDDYDALVARYVDGGATDGWPIIPPDAQGVAALVAASGRHGDDIIGAAPWRPNPITMRDAAINAFMAGCGPELMPLLGPMFETLFSPEGRIGLGGMAASTGGYNCWFVVHGPIAKRLGINGGAGLFGPGAPANVALGRAVRLALMNLAGLKPNLADRSCVGQAYKYGVVIADHGDTSWGPADFGDGLQAGESGFTLVWGFHTRLVMNEEATAPEPLLRSIAEGMTTAQNFDSPAGRAPGATELDAGGEIWIKSLQARVMCLVMSLGHRDVLAAAGWDRARVQSFLAEHCARTVGELRRGGFATSPFFAHDQPDEDRVMLVTGPEKIIPIAAGGPGGASLCFSAGLLLPRKLAA